MGDHIRKVSGCISPLPRPSLFKERVQLYALTHARVRRSLLRSEPCHACRCTLLLSSPFLLSSHLLLVTVGRTESTTKATRTMDVLHSPAGPSKLDAPGLRRRRGRKPPWIASAADAAPDNSTPPGERNSCQKEKRGFVTISKEDEDSS